MTKSRLKPWHEVVRLKEELLTGELSMAQFAADLHEVTLGLGTRPVYEDPERFFGLTYATHALRDLVRDVAGRLAGQSDKAVRQLELTYGGGKTHTLITLYHLFRRPGALPDLPAVHEFREHVGHDLPAAHPVTLCFDKIDVESGIQSVAGPDGETRDLLHPWSVLAYQLDGDDGLRAIHADGQAQERMTPPAEPLLAKLVAKPQERGLSTLILADEVLMYARAKAGVDEVWGDRIRDFFQHLTQAVVKVDRAAMVVSLLATDPIKQSDDLGKAIMADLFDVVRRQKEEGVEPVQKKDVAEVLRRRFFEAEDIRDPDAYRSHVIGVVRNLAKVQETTDRSRSADEDHFLRHFPFHPKLTDVFYTCWTQLDGFQRTRGILRTLATALREAKEWGDACPLVGPAALLANSREAGLSEAMRDLAGVATTEPGEGRKVDWAPLLLKELEKARDMQNEISALDAGREIEQAVVAVFLHSQPVGHKIQTQPLRRMIGAGAPDVIEVNKGLERWREVSWFLDDEDVDGARGELPKDWRLGNRPNLRQMHDDACKNRVTAEAVDRHVNDEVGKGKWLIEGASAAGVKVHRMPGSPEDVADDLAFRYVLLGAGGVSESGKPSKAARSFLETKGKDRPRVHRNALVVAGPSRDGLRAVQGEVRALLGWEEVREQLAGHKVDAVRDQRLRRQLADAQGRVSDALRAAWCIVTTYGRDGEVHAFKLALPAPVRPLFVEIKNDARSRIQETAVDARALAPGGPYDLWRDDEDARFVTDLAGAFARNPRLPKALNAELLFDTVMQGVQDGLFVARLKLPDGAVRTWWREWVEPGSRTDPSLEVVLPQDAELHRLPPELLAPGKLPGLWRGAESAESGGAAASSFVAGGASLAMARLAEYFAGGYEAAFEAAAGEEPAIIPRVSGDGLRKAVSGAVQLGLIWLVSGPASAWRETVPDGVLDEGARLLPPPEPVAPQDLSEDSVPAAWSDGRTNGAALTQALGLKRKCNLPWQLLVQGIKDSVQSRWLSLLPNSGPVDCSWTEAGAVLLERPSVTAPGGDVPGGPLHLPFEPSAPAAAALDAAQVQELGERVPELLEAGPTAQLRFRVQVAADGEMDAAEKTQINEVLAKVAKGLLVD